MSSKNFVSGRSGLSEVEATRSASFSFSPELSEGQARSGRANCADCDGKMQRRTPVNARRLFHFGCHRHLTIGSSYPSSLRVERAGLLTLSCFEESLQDFPCLVTL